MGFLFRAATGFAIAFAVQHGAAVQAALQSPRMIDLKAELAAQHPGKSAAEAALSGLRALVPRNGTDRPAKSGHSRAHRLHSAV